MAEKKMKQVPFDEEEVELKEVKEGEEEEQEVAEDGLPEHKKEESTLPTDDFAEADEGEEVEEEEEEETEPKVETPEQADLGDKLNLLSARLTSGQTSEEFTKSLTMEPTQYVTKEELDKIFRITENSNQEPQFTMDVIGFNALLDKVALAGAKTAIRSTPKVIASEQKETAEVRDKVVEFFKKNKDLVKYSATVTRTLAQNQAAYPEKSVEELLELTNVETRAFLQLKPQAEVEPGKKKKKAPRERVRTPFVRMTGSSQDRTRIIKAGKLTATQKEMDSALGKD